MRQAIGRRPELSATPCADKYSGVHPQVTPVRTRSVRIYPYLGRFRCESDSVSFCIAACSRLLTVPTGMANTWAASRYFNPWKYTNITTCLDNSGSASTAR